MDDLEHQLRTYADQVERLVDETVRPLEATERFTSSRRSPILLAAAVIALVVIGAVALLLTNDEPSESTADADALDPTVSIIDQPTETPRPQAELVEVPNVAGLNADGGRSRLLELGLGVEVNFEPSDTVPANLVIAQSPAPGEPVDAGSIVVLRVSSGAVTAVPNVVGETQESATTILQELGYTVTVRSATSPQDAGTVIGQNPAANVRLAPGEPVEIAVSSGPEVVPVPDVEGLDVVAAIDALAAAGFSIDPEQVGEPSGEIEESRVIRTEPEANTLVADGSLISIVVSTGLSTIEVPQVTDLFADTAITTLRNQGLEVATVFEQVPVGSVGIGRVLTQSPGAFEEVEVGTVITITVGEAAPEATTTSAAP